MGVLYINGQGVQQNYAQAASWFRKAAKQSHAEAQYNLGISYYKGIGVQKNYEQACFWLKKAADQGIEKAIEFLKKN